MKIDLSKGQKVDLTKGNVLSLIALGGGWDAGDNFDLDIFAVGLDSDKKVVPGLVSYFGNQDGLPGCVLDKDNRDGEGDGDDETIAITLAAIPAIVDQVVFGINIYEAASRAQSMGKVRNAFVRLYKVEGDKPEANPANELYKFDLSEDYGTATGVIACRLYRHDGEWKVQAIGEVANGDINEILAAIPEMATKF